MIDPIRIAAWLADMHGRGYPVVRIWLRDCDLVALVDAIDPLHRGYACAGGRFCGVSVTAAGVAPSRVVFGDGRSIEWGTVVGHA